MDCPTTYINGYSELTATPKKVLHFIESGGLYGAERVILNLSREMAQTGDFIPVVGCIVRSETEQSDLYDAAVSEGIEAAKLVIPNRRFPLALMRVARELRQLNVAVIHSHGYKPSVYGFLLKAFSGIPVIATCHLWFEMDKGPLKTRTMIALEKLFYRWFPRVIAVSDDIRQVLINNGVSGEKITVVENGVVIEPHDCSEQSIKLRTSLGIKEDDFCVLNAGRLTRQKAQWTLIEAAAVLKKRKVNIKVLIAGEGRLKESLMDQITQLEVGDRVELLGFRRDVPELLSVCDAFALPSLDEGMPMILLESAARGVAAVTTGVGDIPKLICDGESGLVVPKDDPEALANALERLWKDKELRERLAENARSLMQEKYSSQAMHLKYDGIYRGLLHGAEG